MSSEVTDHLPQGSENFTNEILYEQPGRAAPLLSYRRDFLLSLRNKDVCKKLPSGFDYSLLSEIEEAASHSFEWQRGPGSLPTQSSRRSDYGSSSYSRQDGLGGYSWANNARWDTRSSGSSDKDGNVPFDLDASSQDYGRRSGGQLRRLGPKPEQDGLLGSGVLPRPSGYHQGCPSGSKDRGDSNYQINRSSEPYQPPRPHKSGPYSRKESTDTCNDETFGSSECSDQRRQEEERIRRESFELMRREQRKVLQERQKNVQEKHEENDIGELDPGLTSRRNEKLEKNECSRSSLRPLIPPGFASSVVETNLSKQVPSFSVGSTVEDVGINGSGPLINDSPAVSREDINLNKKDDSGLHAQFFYQSGSSLSILGGLEHSSNDARVPFEHKEWENKVADDSTVKKTGNSEAADDSSSTRVHRTSVLTQLFGDVLSESAGTRAVEHVAPAVVDGEMTWDSSLSSKFASWFIEDPGKPVQSNPKDSSHSRDLLSMIVSKDKGEYGSATSTPAHEGFRIPNLSENSRISTELYHSSGMMTCEDLEQSILAQAEGMPSSRTPLKEVQESSDQNFDLPIKPAHVDNQASVHLLSLLHKGPTQSKECAVVSEQQHGSYPPDDSETGSVESTGKSLTLEALFGSGFMRELHSKDGPVSGQRPSSVDGRSTKDTEISSHNALRQESITDIVGGRLHVEKSLISQSGGYAYPQHLDSTTTNRIPPQIKPIGSENTAHLLVHHDPLQHFLAQTSVHPVDPRVDSRVDPRFHLQIPPQPIPMHGGFAPHPLQYFPRGGSLPHALNNNSMHDALQRHALQGHQNVHAGGYMVQMPGMPGMGPHPSESHRDAEAQLYNHHQHQHHHHQPQQHNLEFPPVLRNR